MASHPALADAEPGVFWLEQPGRPARRPALESSTTADLVVVGGGYSGSGPPCSPRSAARTATCCCSRAAASAGPPPGATVGSAPPASPTERRTAGPAGRGVRHPPPAGPGEPRRDRARGAAVRHLVRLPAHRRAGRGDGPPPGRVAARGAGAGRFLDRDEVRAELDSPTYLAGVLDTEETALVDPARLAWGLADAAESLGVSIAEDPGHRAVQGRRGDARRHRRGTACVPGTWPSGPTRSRRSCVG